MNLLTVPSGKPGTYRSRSFARASANLWISIRAGWATFLKNSSTLESFKIKFKNVSLLGTVLELSSANLSAKVYHCILLVSIVCYTYNIVLLVMFTILDYSSALEYTIIKRNTNIVY